jgi:spermidine/putrescine ABC transporter ATP-binding subunit
MVLPSAAREARPPANPAEGAARPQAIGGHVQLVGLARDYAGVQAVSDVDLSVAPGEFLTLLGASGSGKTTTLMMIAGFVSPSRGDVLVDGRSVVGEPPERRNLGVVFQSYALFPHMTVEENVGFPLRMRYLAREAIRRQVDEALQIVALDGYGKRKITQLSGGQQQRVALARALVFRPPVLLMDEPLGALDRRLREQMQAEIKRIQRSMGLTVIYVTHDQEEALVMSDRIAIMEAGRIHQVDTPPTVYERPATAYVAQFLGESNFIDGVCERSENGNSWVRLSGGERIVARAGSFREGDKVRVMMRPEALSVRRPEGGPPVNAIAAVIEETEYLGQSIRYQARYADRRLTLRETRQEGLPLHEIGAPVTLHWSRGATVLFAAE